jgi:hypothetical protein
MDKKLQIVNHLYGEASDRAELRELLGEEALNAEYQALSEAKFYLDHRHRARPDEGIVDHLVAVAAGEAEPVKVPVRRLEARQDRPPARRLAIRRRSFPALLAAAVVVIAVGIGVWPSPSDPADQAAPSVAEEAPLMDADEARLGSGREALAKAEPEAAFYAGARRADSAVSAARALMGEAVMDEAMNETDESGLAWDEAADLRQMHRRIQMLQENNSDLNWDEAAVPLEQLPGASSTLAPASPGIRAAGQQRPAPRDQ